MTSRSLKNWRARRAGGRITVYGECERTHTPVKITNVDVLTPGRREGTRCVTAVDKDDVTHFLLLA